MAIYYVKTDGNDSNTGLSPSQAWLTIQKAVGGSGITGGDTLYIAPGAYRNTSSTVTMAGIYTTTTNIIGDVTASQFSGTTAGRVLITNRGTSDLSSSFFAGTAFSTGGKSNIVFQTLCFENGNTNSTICDIRDSSNLTFDRCFFYGTSSQQNTALAATGTSAIYTRNHLFSKCIFVGNSNVYSDGNHSSAVGATYDYNLTLDRCINMGVSFSGSLITSSGRGFYMVNCTSCSMSLANTKGTIIAKNSNFLWSVGGGAIFLLQQGAGSASIGNSVERCAYTTTNTYTFVGYNNIALPGPIQSYSENRLFQLSPNYERAGYSTLLNNQGTYTGNVIIPTLAGRAGYTTMGVPLTDIYGNPWDGDGNPHIGAYNDYSLTSISSYIPTDRTRTFLQIESGSTSNSLELYLGATGLTAASTGLSAYYNRSRSNPVQINLVDSTITSSWISGGFAEVSSSFMPGVYRLDVPNEAFAVGADDVTILVRGLSGTNGAFVNCQLTNLSNSSIASTVWSNSSRTITGGIADTVTTLITRSGFAITNVSEVQSGLSTVTINQIGASIGQSISDVGLTSTVTGRIDATISSRLASASYSIPPTEASIASTVWTYTNRTLSSIGLSAYDIWNFADRTLTSSSGATAYEIWNFNDRTLSSTGISAYDVWNYTDRIITGGTGVSITQQFPENFEFMLITNTGRIYLSKPDIKKITG